MKDKKEIVVPLKLIVDAVEEADDNWNQYLDIEKMEVISLPGEYSICGIEEEDQEMYDLIEDGWNVRYFGLPSQFEIHEYSIMERFIGNLPDGEMKDSLENAIRGRGAFRRFKDSIIDYGIEKHWYEFLEKAHRRIAKEWCEENNFKYR